MGKNPHNLPKHLILFSFFVSVLFYILPLRFEWAEETTNDTAYKRISNISPDQNGPLTPQNRKDLDSLLELASKNPKNITSFLMPDLDQPKNYPVQEYIWQHISRSKNPVYKSLTQRFISAAEFEPTASSFFVQSVAAHQKDWSKRDDALSRQALEATLNHYAKQGIPRSDDQAFNIGRIGAVLHSRRQPTDAMVGVYGDLLQRYGYRDDARSQEISRQIATNLFDLVNADAKGLNFDHVTDIITQTANDKDISPDIRRFMLKKAQRKIEQVDLTSSDPSQRKQNEIIRPLLPMVENGLHLNQSRKMRQASMEALESYSNQFFMPEQTDFSQKRRLNSMLDHMVSAPMDLMLTDKEEALFNSPSALGFSEVGKALARGTKIPRDTRENLSQPQLDKLNELHKSLSYSPYFVTNGEFLSESPAYAIRTYSMEPEVISKIPFNQRNDDQQWAYQRHENQKWIAQKLSENIPSWGQIPAQQQRTLVESMLDRAAATGAKIGSQIKQDGIHVDKYEKAWEAGFVSTMEIQPGVAFRDYVQANIPSEQMAPRAFQHSAPKMLEPERKKLNAIIENIAYEKQRAIDLTLKHAPPPTNYRDKKDFKKYQLLDAIDHLLSQTEQEILFSDEPLSATRAEKLSNSLKAALVSTINGSEIQDDALYNLFSTPSRLDHEKLIKSIQNAKESMDASFGEIFSEFEAPEQDYRQHSKILLDAMDQPHDITKDTQLDSAYQKMFKARKADPTSHDDPILQKLILKGLVHPSTAIRNAAVDSVIEQDLYGDTKNKSNILEGFLKSQDHTKVKNDIASLCKNKCFDVKSVGETSGGRTTTARSTSTPSETNRQIESMGTFKAFRHLAKNAMQQDQERMVNTAKSHNTKTASNLSNVLQKYMAGYDQMKNEISQDCQDRLQAKKQGDTDALIRQGAKKSPCVCNGAGDLIKKMARTLGDHFKPTTIPNRSALSRLGHSLCESEGIQQCQHKSGKTTKNLSSSFSGSCDINDKEENPLGLPPKAFGDAAKQYRSGIFSCEELDQTQFGLGEFSMECAPNQGCQCEEFGGQSIYALGDDITDISEHFDKMSQAGDGEKNARGAYLKALRTKMAEGLKKSLENTLPMIDPNDPKLDEAKKALANLNLCISGDQQLAGKINAAQAQTPQSAIDNRKNYLHTLLGTHEAQKNLPVQETPFMQSARDYLGSRYVRDYHKGGYDQQWMTSLDRYYNQNPSEMRAMEQKLSEGAPLSEDEQSYVNLTRDNERLNSFETGPHGFMVSGYQDFVTELLSFSDDAQKQGLHPSQMIQPKRQQLKVSAPYTFTTGPRDKYYNHPSWDGLQRGMKNQFDRSMDSIIKEMDRYGCTNMTSEHLSGDYTPNSLISFLDTGIDNTTLAKGGFKAIKEGVQLFDSPQDKLNAERTLSTLLLLRNSGLQKAVLKDHPEFADIACSFGQDVDKIFKDKQNFPTFATTARIVDTTALVGAAVVASVVGGPMGGAALAGGLGLYASGSEAISEYSNWAAAQEASKLQEQGFYANLGEGLANESFSDVLDSYGAISSSKEAFGMSIGFSVMDVVGTGAAMRAMRTEKISQIMAQELGKAEGRTAKEALKRKLRQTMGHTSTSSLVKHDLAILKSAIGESGGILPHLGKTGAAAGKGIWGSIKKSLHKMELKNTMDELRHTIRSAGPGGRSILTTQQGRALQNMKVIQRQLAAGVANGNPESLKFMTYLRKAAQSGEADEFLDIASKLSPKELKKAMNELQGTFSSPAAGQAFRRKMNAIKRRLADQNKRQRITSIRQASNQNPADLNRQMQLAGAEATEDLLNQAGAQRANKVLNALDDLDTDELKVFRDEVKTDGWRWCF